MMKFGVRVAEWLARGEGGLKQAEGERQPRPEGGGVGYTFEYINVCNSPSLCWSGRRPSCPVGIDRGDRQARETCHGGQTTPPAQLLPPALIAFISRIRAATCDAGNHRETNLAADPLIARASASLIDSEIRDPRN